MNQGDMVRVTGYANVSPEAAALITGLEGPVINAGSMFIQVLLTYEGEQGLWNFTEDELEVI